MTSLLPLLASAHAPAAAFQGGTAVGDRAMHISGARTKFRPTPTSVAITVSVALHVAAGAWAMTLSPQPIAIPVTRMTIRSVHQTVVLQHDPPPMVKPVPTTPAPAPKVVTQAPAAKAPPPKRRMRRQAKPKREAKRPAAFENVAAKPVPAAQAAPPALVAPIPVQVAASAGVAIAPSAPAQAEGSADADSSAVDPRAGHVDGHVGGTGVDLSGYGARVRAAVQRRQHYPDAAEEDGLEGTVRVRVVLRPDGTLLQPPKVVRSSGHRVLDQEAVRMVRASAPFADLPTGFKAGTAELTIPIVFELEDDDF